ncbi:MAG: hypothetical protein CME64_15260 [Halobacteriovoraceae bacterium]|nr:hypothetical protein [Halobacteriovoraceae bacterium]|tara:strand:+ start:94684 stop:95403 length:720 start_codon:yes stop_codon:yes gene_type:complete
MKIKVVCLFFIALFSGQCFSKQIKDLYFEIHSDDLKSLVEENYKLKKLGGLYCKVYWTEGRNEVVVVTNDLADNNIKASIKKACSRKAQLAIPNTLGQYLKGFKKIKSSDGWDTYQDTTGLSDKNEILVKRGASFTRLIVKKATGTTKLHYYYRQVKNHKILRKLKVSSYEGIQNVKSTINIVSHGKRNKYVPKKVVVNTSQNLIKKGVGSYSRSLKEIYHFKNYKINNSKAVLYFSKK